LTHCHPISVQNRNLNLASEGWNNELSAGLSESVLALRSWNIDSGWGCAAGRAIGRVTHNSCLGQLSVLLLIKQAQKMPTFQQYGLNWPQGTDPLLVEMHCIKKGGVWTEKGQKLGMGLSFHYEQMRKLIWPHLDDHRWHRICRDEIFRPGSTVTVLMGPGSSGKTHEASWTYLCEYFCFPQETCVLVSSTDIRGLRLRVWGEIAMLWDMAIKRYDWLPGHLLDSKLAITTDSLDDGDIDDRSMRDMRKGIIGIPTVQNGKFIGLGKWVGIKQKRVRLIADEASMMGSTFLSAFANLNKNENFQAIVLGNPNDPLDPLGKAAEPKEGWSDDYLEPDKTSVWDTRFMNGRCVNLIGLDSPNMDFPADQPTRYRYLISRKKIDETLSFFPKDSVEYYSQCVGSMKIGTMAKRVIDRKTCLKFGAFEDVVWAGSSRITKIAALDASYGGDRCALTLGEFGMDKDNRLILSTSQPVIVPISVKSTDLPEDQISLFCRSYCEKHGVEPGNFFHDSTGRGTLGTSLARIWSNECNPVEFGGSPSERPVTLDWYIDDPETGIRRLKLASEHYAHFVDELWYSVRYSIEGGQLCNLPQEVMEEGALRKWDWVKNKVRLETKIDMKERVGRSPDLFDSLAILVEGARRRGFSINKLSNKDAKSSPKTNSFRREAKGLAELLKKRVLQAA
jgi:hypothetical protein